MNAIAERWIGGCRRFQRRGTVQGAVRPVLIVVSFVLAQDPPQMGLVPDQGAVEELGQCAVQSVYGCDATALGATVGTSDVALPGSYTARSMSQSLL
jgi:hypothetical protein